MLNWASLVAQRVRNLPAMQEMEAWSLGWEDPLKEEKATHSSILAWEFLGQRSLADYSPWGLKRVRRKWITNAHTMCWISRGENQKEESFVLSLGWDSGLILLWILYRRGSNHTKVNLIVKHTRAKEDQAWVTFLSHFLFPWGNGGACLGPRHSHRPSMEEREQCVATVLGARGSPWVTTAGGIRTHRRDLSGQS